MKSSSGKNWRRWGRRMNLRYWRGRNMRRWCLRSSIRSFKQCWRGWISWIRSWRSTGSEMSGSLSLIVPLLLDSPIARPRHQVPEQPLRHRWLLPGQGRAIRHPKIHIKPSAHQQPQVRHQTMGADRRLQSPNHLVLRRMLPPFLLRRLLPRQHQQQIHASHQ